jgi:hypothetical protein
MNVEFWCNVLKKLQIQINQILVYLIEDDIKNDFNSYIAM